MNEPRRIRLPDGRVPMLTPAQREKIITVDLASPPSFIGVLDRIEDVRRIVGQPDALEEAWLYRPGWGDAKSIFDRQQAFMPHHGNYGLLNSFVTADIMEDERHAVARILDAPVAKLFIDNLRNICLKAAANLSGCSYVYGGIDFEQRTMPSDVHIDVQEIRMFAALEHGNVVLPDMAVARDKGFTFLSTTGAANNPWELVDLIEAGVSVYSAALGDLTFMRGHLPPGRPTWHAAYPKNPAINCDRPTIKADFTFG